MTVITVNIGCCEPFTLLFEDYDKAKNFRDKIRDYIQQSKGTVLCNIQFAEAMSGEEIAADEDWLSKILDDQIEFYENCPTCGRNNHVKTYAELKEEHEG